MAETEDTHEIDLVGGEEIVVDPAVPGSVAVPSPQRPARLKRQVMTILRVSHRWASLTLGLVLVVITTSGALLLLQGYLDGKDDHDAQHTATRSDHPLTLGQGLTILQRRFPKQSFSYVTQDRGVISAITDDGTVASVDPGTGRVTGSYVSRPSGFFGVMAQLHDCFFTCDDYPWSSGWLTKPMPDLGIPGVEKLARGSFLLGVTAVLMFFLVLGGVVLWWPGLRRWRRGFELRARKGRYKRDYDLHKLVGIVALPPLFLWAFSGMDFELPVVGNLTAAVLPGKTVDPSYNPLSKPGRGPDITPDEAAAAAVRKNGGGKAVQIDLPAQDDPTSPYYVATANGINWQGEDGGHGSYMVDRRDPTNVGDDFNYDGSLPSFLLGNPFADTHEGLVAQGTDLEIPIRIALFIFGMTPLVLMVTGISTWLYKRKVRKRSRARRRAAQESTPVVA